MDNKRAFSASLLGIAIGGLLFLPFAERLWLRKVQTGIESPASLSVLPAYARHGGAMVASEEQYYLYLLVDESLTANVQDPEGRIRYTVARRVLEFVTAYGWLAQTPPIIEIYQYSQKWEKNNDVQPLWPPTGEVNLPVVLNDEQKMTVLGGAETLAEVLKSIKNVEGSNHQGTTLVDRPDVVLRFIRDHINRIKGNSSEKNLLVIMITDGYPVEEGVDPSVLGERIKAAANAWGHWDSDEVPVGIFLVKVEEDRVPSEWKKNFFDYRKTNMGSFYEADIFLVNEEFSKEGFSGDSDKITRQVRYRIWRMFEKGLHWLNGSSVLKGEISAGKNQVELEVQPPRLGLAVLKAPLENLHLDAPDGTPVTPQQWDNADIQLRWWDVAFSPPGVQEKWIFKRDDYLNEVVPFIYSSFATRPTPTPTPTTSLTTPNPTPTATLPTTTLMISPTQTSAVTETQSKHPEEVIGSSYLWSVALVFLIAVIVHFVAYHLLVGTVKRYPQAVMTYIFLAFDSMMGAILIRIFLTGHVGEILWEGIGFWITVLIGTAIPPGGLFVLIRNKTKEEAIQREAKLAQLLPFAGILFALEFVRLVLYFSIAGL
jgi:hypothetical protein